MKGITFSQCIIFSDQFCINVIYCVDKFAEEVLLEVHYIIRYFSTLKSQHAAQWTLKDLQYNQNNWFTLKKIHVDDKNQSSVDTEYLQKSFVNELIGLLLSLTFLLHLDTVTLSIFAN